MDRQDYENANMEPSFPHDTSKDSNEIPTMSYHGIGENNLTLSQQNFPMTDGYFGGGNSQASSSNIHNVPVSNPLDHNVAFESNQGQNFNSTDQRNQSYCSEFPNQIASSLPFSGSFQPQEEQFASNMPQSQMFSAQVPPSEFPSPSNLFSTRNEHAPPDSMGNFPNTSEYLDCNSKPLFPVMVPNDSVDTNLYSASNGCEKVNLSTFSLGHFYPTPVENMPRTVDACDPFENESPTQSGSGSILHPNNGQLSSQSDNDHLPHSNTEEFLSQHDGNDVPHSNSEEFPSQNVNAVPHSNCEEFPTQHDSNAVPHSNCEEFPSQHDSNAIPHSNCEEVSSQQDSNAVSHSNCEEFPLQLDSNAVSHSTNEEFPCQNDSNDLPHSNCEEVSCQPDNNDVPHSNNEEISSGNADEANLFDPLQFEGGSSSQTVSSINHEGLSNNSEDATGQCNKVTSENDEDGNKLDNLYGIDNPSEAIVSENTGGFMSSSNKDVDESAECGSTMETLDDLSASLEKGIEASLEESCSTANNDQVEADTPRPLSPMITALDKEFLVEPKKEVADGADNIRLTRTRTGAVRNKTQRYVDEIEMMEDSQESVIYEEWQYEEGAELAPSVVDPSVTVNDDVLRVTPRELASYYQSFVEGVDTVLNQRLHCTACGVHIGAAPNYIHLGNRHKVLRVLICNKCRTFYGVGKFSKDSDGSELFCRWCGQGGQVICCSSCPNVFCQLCIRRNIGEDYLNSVVASNFWACFLCNYEILWPLRAVCWALLTYTMKRKKDALSGNDSRKTQELQDDKSRCCPKQTKKRKPPSKSKVINPSASLPGNLNGLQLGHFLFGGGEQHVRGSAADEDEYIDPSQFVQSVLEEPRRLQPKVLAKPIMPRLGPQISVSSFQSPVRPVQIQPRPVLLQTNPPRTVRAVYSQPPRLFVRQGNMMRPGLLPINNQPNSVPLQVATRFRGPSLLRNSAPIRLQTPFMRTDPPVPQNPAPTRTAVRNPACVINNLDGVRSMEQIQALDQVPWYRDGIDNVRAVGFALTKRIRELEARFHSLKSKQDVEKIMSLGRKLEKLSERTEKRFKKINATLKDACREWCVQKMRNSPTSVDPFRLGKEEGISDWDDDVELSKPLEKVLIPVNSASLQAGAIRPAQPRVISRTNPPPLATMLGPAARAGQPQPQSVSNVSYSVRLPGPKSSASRFVQIGDLSKSITHTVGAIINKRNGPNSISVSLTPAPKRKRLESSSSNGSDVVMVYPTIPELIKLYNIKPCVVRLQRNDSFIVNFLERQEHARSQNAMYDDTLDVNEVESVMSPQVSINDLEAEAVISSSDFPEHFLSSLVEMGDTFRDQADTTESNSTSNVESLVQNDDDDDDIEIIDEVSVSK
ncbi:uncharacterized protein LOC117648668 [Thrips palmi]|uniref:Uncharacterized protein LOC117648668 n=1 Tax=Thrips palmi TaxID=161013 RepID=A0A6P8ZR95_THRPL|nr:uncharacterized protein LOC117648668 [Thrips palmi]XP_034247214.1 uncharacterized protein LOC117648668 [Thrips palmi]